MMGALNAGMVSRVARRKAAMFGNSQLNKSNHMSILRRVEYLKV